MIKKRKYYDLPQNPQLHLHIVSHSNLVIGMRVQDNEGNVGTIKHYDEELHNVFVDYDNGGSGLHCLNEGCKEPHEVNGHKFEIEQYDPLYYFG